MRDITKEFNELLAEHGYTSILSFCKQAGIDRANMGTNIKGRYNLSIDRAFKIANTLEIPITAVLKLFYPEEMEQNETYCNQL